MEIGGFNISIFPIHIWYTNTKFPYFKRFRKIVLFRPPSDGGLMIPPRTFVDVS